MSTKHLFVQKLANLEGYKGVDVARGFYEDLSVSSVDARVIHLEKVLNIAPPPPMLEATWESLEFRAKRLWRFLPAPSLAVAVDDQPMAVTPEALRKVILRLEPSPLSREPERKAKKADLAEKKLGDDGGKEVAVEAEGFNFAYAAQQLYHLAGQNGWAVCDPVKDIDHLYAAAIDLTLKMEMGPAPGRPFPRPGMRPGDMASMFPRGPPPPPPRPKKGCCGCCSCLCHSTPVRVRSLKRKKIATGFFKFGWLRNLFSRKKKHYDSDTSSINTTSSEESTLID